MAPTVATNTRASSSEPMAMKPYQTRWAQAGGWPYTQVGDQLEAPSPAGARRAVISRQ